MKKTVISLTLLLSLITSVGCSNSATAKGTEKDGTKVDVMYTYGEKDTEEVTADNVYDELVNSTAGSKALFDAVYKKVIEERIAKMEGKNEEIIKEVDEEMVTWLQDAKDQASDNGVSSDTMIESLLEEEGVDSTEELTEKKIYNKQKKYVEDYYFDTYRNAELDLVNQYVTNYFPMHIKGILVKVADTNYTYFARSITEDEADKLARTTKELINGKEFNILACDTNFSDHSTSQITTGGDLGIMDVTTSFNNEYKLGLYTYFAYGDSYGDDESVVSEQALKLLVGDDLEENKDLVERYDNLYKNGFNVITYEQAEKLDLAADRKEYADGTLVDSNKFDGDYKTLNLPRNVLYNNNFNSHKVSFLKATNDTQYTVEVNCAAGEDAQGNPVRVTETVVANKYDYPILVLTDENGVQFISIEMDSFGDNAAASDEYFGATEGNKITITLNGEKRENVTPYFAQAGNADKTTRKETVDTQVKNFINKGYGSSVSANQDFYYFRIYNEFVSEDADKNLATLFGSDYKKEGTKQNTYYKQVTNYINAITTYREALIQSTIKDTGEAFAKTLELQDSYIEANWVRPEWLAASKDELTAFQTGNTTSVASGYENNVDYWNKNLGGGALYVK